METTNPASPWYPYVWVDPERMSGEPCLRNTRLPVKDLFDYLAAGDSVDEYIEAFDGVPRDMVLGVLKVAAAEAAKAAAASGAAEARAA